MLFGGIMKTSRDYYIKWRMYKAYGIKGDDDIKFSECQKLLKEYKDIQNKSAAQFDALLDTCNFDYTECDALEYNPYLFAPVTKNHDTTIVSLVPSSESEDNINYRRVLIGDIRIEEGLPLLIQKKKTFSLTKRGFKSFLFVNTNNRSYEPYEQMFNKGIPTIVGVHGYKYDLSLLNQIGKIRNLKKRVDNDRITERLAYIDDCLVYFIGLNSRIRDSEYKYDYYNKQHFIRKI